MTGKKKLLATRGPNERARGKLDPRPRIDSTAGMEREESKGFDKAAPLTQVLLIPVPRNASLGSVPALYTPSVLVLKVS